MSFIFGGKTPAPAPTPAYTPPAKPESMPEREKRAPSSSAEGDGVAYGFGWMLGTTTAKRRSSGREILG